MRLACLLLLCDLIVIGQTARPSKPPVPPPPPKITKTLLGDWQWSCCQGKLIRGTVTNSSTGQSEPFSAYKE
jgi:hypothetical protein